MRISNAQKLIINSFKNERVHVELVNKEKYEDILVKDIDIYHMAFLLEMPGGDELIPLKSIFRMKNRNGEELESGELKSHIKHYDSQIGTIQS